MDNSHVSPAFRGILNGLGRPIDSLTQAQDRITSLEREKAELVVTLEARNKTIALREQNILDLESERDQLVEVMFSIVEHRGIAGTAAHTAMRDVLKRLGYDHSDDARED